MSKINNLKALWALVIIFGLSITIAQAQTTGKVGINTDNPKATLDVKKGASDYPGVIAPRIGGDALQAINYGTDQNGAIVYATSASATAGTAVQTEYVTEKGYYYFDATAASNAGRWIRLVAGDPVAEKKVNWFYMPSISIPTNNAGDGVERTLNLYDQYVAQFTNPDVKSGSAPAAIPNFPQADQLYYYITDYDDAVLEINQATGLSDSGELKYKVLTAPTPCSFINIVFVIK